MISVIVIVFLLAIAALGVLLSEINNLRFKVKNLEKDKKLWCKASNEGEV